MAAWRRSAGAVLAALILAGNLTPAARHLLGLPAVLTVAAGQVQTVRLDLPGSLAVRAAGPAAGLLVDGAAAGAGWRRVPGAALQLNPRVPGVFTLGLRLFGVLPWRALRVQALPVPEVSVSGQAVGVVLDAVGPLVVRLEPVAGRDGPVPSPAAAAGLRVGDYLLTADGQGLQSAADIRRALGTDGGAPLALTVLRGGRTLALQVHPAYDLPAGRYLLGAWVRQEGSGIGTLTFAASTAAGAVFGALGHPVSDPTTGQAIALRRGSLLPTLISGVQPSREGHPGEKEGVLVGSAPPLGTVTANTPFGVFGQLTAAAGAELLPVALEDQVHTGPAELLTVLAGSAVGAYAVRITAVLPQRRAAGKGLVLRVTDAHLLAATGGIVQGMSGSPLVQDGRLVGAVTHVLIDNPSRGYGVFALWMAQVAGLVGAEQAQSV